MKKCRSKGISLISLIITIIVIIILAAIVIFSGMGTPEKAQLSVVISDIDNVQTAVDQAYYGLYAEKSVEGEVWTKGQLYESIATGESNREDLSGVGIVEISEAGMVKMSLPKYEGRSWGVAVENIDETVQTGSVVLYPGFETAEKVYSTLLDTQTGGRDSQLEETINANIKVKNLRITTDSSGTTLAGEKIDEGTKLYISFDVSQNASTVTVTPSIPYEVTENGSYIFTLTNVEGKTKKYKVNVDNYLVPTLPNVVKIGDYVDYKPDVKTYTTRPEYTGASAQTLTTEDSDWRVLYVDKETEKTYITTNKVVNASKVCIGGIVGVMKGDEELNKICQELYSNKTLGIYSRSINENDILYKINKSRVAKKIEERYAYYPKGAILSGEYTINPDDGNSYINRICENATTRFYKGMGESPLLTDSSNGLTYRIPEINRPVYVIKREFTDFNYDEMNETEEAIYEEIFPFSYSSLNSWFHISGNLDDEDRFAYKENKVEFWNSYNIMVKDHSFISYKVYDSSAANPNLIRVPSFGLRPIVEIDSSVLIDKINNPTNDGSTPEKAWKLIKK